MQHRAPPGPYRDRLRYDSNFWLEMQFCDEHGIPHSQFLEWDPDSRAKALAFLIEKAERCALCGTAGWEWEENRRAYTPVEHFCMGCYLKSALEDDAGSSPGTTIRLVSSQSQAAAQRLMKQRREAARERRHAGRERPT